MPPLKNPARTRRRLMFSLALGLAMLMPSAILLQTGALGANHTTTVLIILAVGLLLAAPGSIGLTVLQLRALRDRSMNQELNDELSTRNSVRAMAVGYVAIAAAAGYTLPLSVFIDMPLAPVLTGVLLSGVLAHVLSFAIFERQGDDG
ncbi:hypothetical protein IWC96_06000 [Brevundimonas sp. BAL450]|jgi:hypothetical protein|uniref:Uncharacterized protein n=2 Tax=Brevundimonas TaxID=41275 RepID=A0A8E0NBA7_9CAUL|nr:MULTISPECIES: hypothetical protein [Brevundimonas]MBG7614833.1 hypothetical protein [Brevundimonas sp. BAL450]GAD59218.1 hypothetical protein MBEBAB_1468 [Brevundimonas abyssalis TAR-001]